MKKSTKIAVAVLAVILAAVLLMLSVPVPLLSMLNVPEGESWRCEVMQPAGGITVLEADRTEVLVRRMEHAKVCFRGWAEDVLTIQEEAGRVLLEGKEFGGAEKI